MSTEQKKVENPCSNQYYMFWLCVTGAYESYRPRMAVVVYTNIEAKNRFFCFFYDLQIGNNNTKSRYKEANHDITEDIFHVVFDRKMNNNNIILF